MMVHMNARSMDNLNYECEQINTETSLYYSLEAFASNVTRMCLSCTSTIGMLDRPRSKVASLASIDDVHPGTDREQ
jgi:hypothetical protein